MIRINYENHYLLILGNLPQDVIWRPDLEVCTFCCVVTLGRLRSLVNNGGGAVQLHNIFRPAAATVSRKPWNFSSAIGERLFGLSSPS